MGQTQNYRTVSSTVPPTYSIYLESGVKSKENVKWDPAGMLGSFFDPGSGNEKFVKRVRCGGIFNIQPELEFARIQDRFGIYRRCLALLAFHFVR